MGIKYFEGHLGLFNSYHFSSKNLFNTTAGVMARYSGGYRVFLIPCASAAACEAQLSKAGAILGAEPRYSEARIEGGTIFLVDGRKDRIMIRGIGPIIVALTGLLSFEQGERIFLRVKEML